METTWMKLQWLHGIASGRARIAMLVLLLVPLLSMVTGAQTVQQSAAQIYCANVITPQSPINANIVGDIIPILLTMTAIIALVYLFGYTFRIDKLLRFGKTEFGELIVTGIVVSAFIGGIFAVSNPNNYYNAFNTDCQQLYTNFYIMLGEFRGILLSNFVISFISSTSFELDKNYWGIKDAAPLVGLSYISTVLLSTLTNVAFGIAGLQLAITLVLAIFFTLLPLFFYAGIIFRTFPWTRAVGGAFLGLFAAFYIAFPGLMSVMLVTYCQGAGTPGGCTLPAAIGGANYIGNQLGSVPSSSLSPLGDFSVFKSYFSGWDFSALFFQFSSTISNVIAPSLSNIIAILVAFLISYDLMEALGDLLGSPSLSSSTTFRRLL
ncbi:MAG: hypothetical protein LVQ95_01435 [Candidatus Micrarchaeales archaeon]|nr:hypothetical protein [Candidatus Micrarchaeales archaeon]